ncbi:hypothetical protein [Haliangium sp.]|uniref:hypothetical protein n=1 Tax=Haliangium sp. TaxID=2663208 RepID=UPI003D1260C4
MNVTLWAGAVVPRPVPLAVSEALEDIEVVQSSDARSGFQLSLRTDRKGLSGALDFRQIASPALRPLNRLMIAVALGGIPSVLMDGVITYVDFDPVARRVTVTGEDLAVVMDRDEKIQAHPGRATHTIVTTILAAYSAYRIVPSVIPPKLDDPPNPVERSAIQHATDLAYLELLARRHGYIFHIDPGPALGASTAYWGPATRVGVPQPALTVDLDGESNIESIRFRSDALAPTTVDGSVRDRISNQTVPLRTPASTQVPLSTRLRLGLNTRTITPRDSAGSSTLAAMGRALADTERSTDDVVVADGELDTARYGSVLRPPGLIGVRGAGYSHDGTYVVKRVTHRLRPGSYKQAFTLARDGWGALSPTVRL